MPETAAPDAPINPSRLEAMMEKVSTFGGEPNGAMNRLTLSKTDGLARDWLGEWFRDHQFEQQVDAIGNQFGKLSLAGANAPTVMPSPSGSGRKAVWPPAIFRS
jgi:N-carbamoyl-L-amino-acid hydrolase